MTPTLPPAPEPHARGVFLNNSMLPGVRTSVDAWVYDSAGYLVMHTTAPNTPVVRALLTVALWRVLNEIDPVAAVAPVSERDRVRELLAVSAGGDRPARGRPRARRPLTIVRGGLRGRA